jgi:hypothetical protein
MPTRIRYERRRPGDALRRWFFLAYQGVIAHPFIAVLVISVAIIVALEIFDPSVVKQLGSGGDGGGG